MKKGSTIKKTRKNNLPQAAPVTQRLNALVDVGAKKDLPQPAPVAQRLKALSVSVDAEVMTDMMRRVILEFAEAMPDQTDPEIIDGARARRGRQYAVRMRVRMHRFSKIYNAAWFVRHVESAEQSYRDQKMQEFWRVCVQELSDCKDIEAFTYAVADALTAYRYGFPWEG